MTDGHTHNLSSWILIESSLNALIYQFLVVLSLIFFFKIHFTNRLVNVDRFHIFALKIQITAQKSKWAGLLLVRVVNMHDLA